MQAEYDAVGTLVNTWSTSNVASGSIPDVYIGLYVTKTTPVAVSL